MSSCKNCKSLLPLDGTIIFCPTCGETILNMEKETEFAGKKKVSLKWQTFLAIIPFCVFISSHRIKKIRKFAIIFIISQAVATIIAGLCTSTLLHPWYLDLFPSENYTDWDGTADTYSGFTFLILTWSISTIFLVYYVRKYSRQWNNKIQLYRLIDK